MGFLFADFSVGELMLRGLLDGGFFTEAFLRGAYFRRAFCTWVHIKGFFVEGLMSTGLFSVVIGQVKHFLHCK